MDEKLKKCSSCKELKILGNFCKNNARPDKLDGACRECHKKRRIAHRDLTSKYSQAYNSRPEVKIKNRDRARKYRSTLKYKTKQPLRALREAIHNSKPEIKARRIARDKAYQKFHALNQNILKTKVCCGCKKEKISTDFCRNNSTRDGLQGRCEECRRVCNSIRNAKITVKIKKRNYERELRKNNIGFRLRAALRSRLNHAIKNNFKSGSAVRNSGCSIEFLKQYLVAFFLPGMTWENWGPASTKKITWHIDHIMPLSSFDLTAPEQFKKACHYTNLRPMWAKDSLSKGAKLPQ